MKKKSNLLKFTMLIILGFVAVFAVFYSKSGFVISNMELYALGLNLVSILCVYALFRSTVAFMSKALDEKNNKNIILVSIIYGIVVNVSIYVFIMAHKASKYVLPNKINQLMILALIIMFALSIRTYFLDLSILLMTMLKSKHPIMKELIYNYFKCREIKSIDAKEEKEHKKKMKELENRKKELDKIYKKKTKKLEELRERNKKLEERKKELEKRKEELEKKKSQSEL
ncbi:MAG: hypothetical protein ACRC5M_06700 [Anaeroplasmataceae bacterium]